MSNSLFIDILLFGLIDIRIKKSPILFDKGCGLEAAPVIVIEYCQLGHPVFHSV